jgi:hypothetical protein
MSGYQIADEPAPSTLARFAVNPLYPMLAAMLAGVWFAWPWFAFNSFAIGSPTRRAELAWLVAGLILPPGIGSALILARGAALLPASAGPYIGLAVIVSKLVVVYAVFLLQSRTIEIYEYYGGKLVNGIWALLAAFYVGDRLLEGLPVLLRLTLS